MGVLYLYGKARWAYILTGGIIKKKKIKKGFNMQVCTGFLCRMIITLLSTIYLSGCATLTQGENQYISFSSKPESAQVIVTGRNVGKTPISAPLSRKELHTVVIQLEGYIPFTITLRNKQSNRIWSNCLLLGLAPFGMMVDYMTDAAVEIYPDTIAIELVPQYKK